MRVWKEAHGSMTYWLVQLDGEPARYCGEADTHTKQQAIEIARAKAEWARRRREAEQQLRAEYPNAPLCCAALPRGDTEWDGAPGWYVYALKPRRRRGKYQIAKAIRID